jgi:hypothetical protein
MRRGPTGTAPSPHGVADEFACGNAAARAFPGSALGPAVSSSHSVAPGVADGAAAVAATCDPVEREQQDRQTDEEDKLAARCGTYRLRRTARGGRSRPPCNPTSVLRAGTRSLPAIPTPSGRAQARQASDRSAGNLNVGADTPSIGEPRRAKRFVCKVARGGHRLNEFGVRPGVGLFEFEQHLRGHRNQKRQRSEEIGVGHAIPDRLGVPASFRNKRRRRELHSQETRPRTVCAVHITDHRSFPRPNSSRPSAAALSATCA